MKMTDEILRAKLLEYGGPTMSLALALLDERDERIKALEAEVTRLKGLIVP